MAEAGAERGAGRIRKGRAGEEESAGGDVQRSVRRVDAPAGEAEGRDEEASGGVWAEIPRVGEFRAEVVEGRNNVCDRL